MQNRANRNNCMCSRNDCMCCSAPRLVRRRSTQCTQYHSFGAAVACACSSSPVTERTQDHSCGAAVACAHARCAVRRGALMHTLHTNELHDPLLAAPPSELTSGMSGKCRDACSITPRTAHGRTASVPWPFLAFEFRPRVSLPPPPVARRRHTRAPTRAPRARRARH